MKKVFAALAISTLALTAVTTSVNAATPPFNDPIIIPSDKGGITPFALLLDQHVTFNGEGTASFQYRGGGDLRFYIKNTGSKEFSYSLTYPNGDNLVRGPLDAGKQDKFEFDVERVHGKSSYGKYTVYVSNSDGSAGSFQISARSLDQ
ncbi:hypothetical protein NLX71_15815 [Paenibacillus sp. MZ04-78.2]|uniref:hypothetical protein n=1 Tax=Paenibacillus sp. MZ04-78.2 TaxID=2962034 RepID=UPI0020B9004D|nr:hypothetical protein [Paenibacillus sp. MZ04-78.2]MCP3774759.1 hypothetical protein [Paenibacillus sp. MZ04-78.2]